MKAIILTASNMSKKIEGKEYSGKCVTAMDVYSNKVVRFVGNRFGAPIEDPWCDKFSPLDIVEIDVLEECPLHAQTENVLADYRNAKKIGEYNQHFREIFDKFKTINYGDSAFIDDGFHKLDSVDSYKHSLEIVRVHDLEITREPNSRAKCSFNYNGIQYKYFSVTDPNYQFPATVGEAFLVVTIPADRYDNGKVSGYYKFVAAVFTPVSLPWSQEEDDELRQELYRGWDKKIIACIHKRDVSEILARKEKLGL